MGCFYRERQSQYNAANMKRSWPRLAIILLLGALVVLVSSTPQLDAAPPTPQPYPDSPRMQSELLVGLREVMRRAFGHVPTPSDSAEFARVPRDNPRIALMLGTVTAGFYSARSGPSETSP